MTGTRWEELGLGPAPRKRITLYEPVGCSKCFGTGYRGRVGLYEVLIVDDELRDIIATGGTVLDIQRSARAKGTGSLRDDGVAKVLERGDELPRAPPRHRLTPSSPPRRRRHGPRRHVELPQ